jgi:hypothetical protein
MSGIKSTKMKIRKMENNMTYFAPAKTPDVEKQDCIRGILIAKKK